MKALQRIANALEHIAWNQMIHEDCDICLARKKPPKPMPTSRVMTDEDLIKVQERIRVNRMLHGPEQPVGDMFRYRELNKNKN
jgi:hypothetical protein